MADDNYSDMELAELLRLRDAAAMRATAMEPDAVKHVVGLSREFNAMMITKYTKGQAEHGGHLWEMDSQALLDEAINEAVDQVVYLLTLRRKLHGPRS